MRSYCNCCLLLSGLLLETSAAWGPILEQLKGGEGFAVRFILQARKDDSTTEDETEQQYPTPARRYSFTQRLDYRESRRNLEGDFIPRLFVSRPLLVDFDVFGIVNPFDPKPASTPTPSFDDGDDDEDCLIPEEYKLADPQDAAYVLEFLGIQRAKPVESLLPGPTLP